MFNVEILLTNSEVSGKIITENDNSSKQRLVKVHFWCFESLCVIVSTISTCIVMSHDYCYN